MTAHADIAEVEFLGLRFARLDAASALRLVLDRSRLPGFSYLVTPNVDHVVRLDRARRADPDGIARAYDSADISLCDSRILALLARRSGIELPVVPGSDLTARLLSTPLPAGTRIALVGGNDRQRRWLAAAQPHATVLHHQPPMGLRTNPSAQTAAAEFVEQAGPNITLFTVGAPQSEIVAHLIKSRGRARGVALCVGASLEFLTGEKRRAPRAFQAARLEWLFRLASEPRRLWRRYLVEGPAIFRIWRRWERTRGG